MLAVPAGLQGPSISQTKTGLKEILVSDKIKKEVIF